MKMKKTPKANSRTSVKHSRLLYSEGARFLGPKNIASQEDARAIGRIMAEKVTKKLKLKLTA